MRPADVLRRLARALALVTTTGLAAAAPAEAAGLRDAMRWLAGQQERSLGLGVELEAPDDPAWRGVLAGHVARPEALAGARVAVPHVAFAQAYGDAYEGPVAGRWGGVGDPAAHRVQVWSVADVPYLQGTFDLRADGTWTSGDTIARPGRKEAVLVRGADGARVAVSGGPEAVVEGVAVRVVSRADVEYLQEEVSLGADGRFATTRAVGPGTKVARVVERATGRVLDSSEWTSGSAPDGLLRSFAVPPGDPARGMPVAGRSWVYDDALAALAFLANGRPARAREVLDALAALQEPDGGLRFALDSLGSRAPDDYRRAGAMAWVGTAAVEYELRTGQRRFRRLAVRVADHLRTLQVTPANGFSPGDPRLGSVLGGRGRYLADGTFVDEPVLGAGTEHNVDCYFLFRDLGRLTGARRFTASARLVARSLLEHHWDAAEGRFLQGVGDPAHALDTASWGGLFLLAVGERAKARQALEHLERFRARDAGIAGYRPYLPGHGYVDAPSVVWAEGTWGAILLKKRLGLDVRADVAAMRRMQALDPAGGVLQVTRSVPPAPYELVAWPAVGSTAWAAIVLGDDRVLWRSDDDAVTPVTATSRRRSSVRRTGRR